MTLLQQTSFMNSTKQELKASEFIVYCDFSENYSFFMQHETQDYHWSNVDENRPALQESG